MQDRYDLWLARQHFAQRRGTSLQPWDIDIARDELAHVWNVSGSDAEGTIRANETSLLSS
jgi:hypothetical protein